MLTLITKANDDYWYQFKEIKKMILGLISFLFGMASKLRMYQN